MKRALPDPLRRIELRDMITDKVAEVSRSLADAAPTTARDLQTVDTYLDTMLEATKPLLAMLVHGVRYDDGTHTALWVEALQGLLDRIQSQPAQLIQVVDELGQYPSLLALRAMSIEAVRQRRDDVLVKLLSVPRWSNPLHSNRSPIAAYVLHPLIVLDSDIVNQLPRWNGDQWRYPTSHLLWSVLHDFFQDHGVEPAQYQTLCHDVEYRTGLVQYLLPGDDLYRHDPASGEFVGEQRWSHRTEAPHAEERFREDLRRNGDAAWVDLLGDRDLEDVLLSYRDILKKYIKHF